MRIGIDVNGLSKSKSFTGVSNYLYNILRHLGILDEKNEYFLYNNEDINLPLGNQRWRKRISYGLFVSSHAAWLNTVLVRQLVKDNIDVFWQPAGAFLPIFMPARIKTILTIHDMVLYYYPETMEWGNRFISRLFFDSSYRRADAIMVDSNSTAKNIEELFHNSIGRKSVIVIYPGVSNERFKPLDKEKSKNFVNEKFKINKDYILFVGTIEPRKNIEVLIKAFHSLVQYRRDLNHQLVIVGKKGWGKFDIPSLLHQSDLSEKEIKFLGYVDTMDLVYLYSGATAFVMPSLYEGFGLPILEAMACGCPVVTSNISSMPEVAGESAVLVNPNNFKELADILYNIMVDKRLREEMQKKGLENIRRFSWENATRDTLQLINTM